MKKIIIGFLLGLLSTSFVYLFYLQNIGPKNLVNPYNSIENNSRSEQLDSSQETTFTSEKSNSTDLFQFASQEVSKRKNPYIYLAYQPELNSPGQLFFYHYDRGFSFENTTPPWKNMTLVSTADLSAYGCEDQFDDCNVPLEEFKGIISYRFCSDNYCDPEERKGTGFDLTLFNAKYKLRNQDPHFEKDGDIFITEDENYVYAYKPFPIDESCKNPPKNLSRAVEVCKNQRKEFLDGLAKLFKGFKIYKSEPEN